MKRIWTLTLCSIVAFAGPALGQYSYSSAAPGNPQTMVSSWYQRYLHRPIDIGAVGKIQALRTGHSPEEMLSAILSSEEYYRNAGGSDPAFIQRLFMDLVGRLPAGPEITYWIGWLRSHSRKDVAYQLLLRHPQGWSILGTDTGSPVRRRTYYYDPGYYPLDPASLNFRDPGGPYFKSPYLPNYEYRRPIRAFPLGARG